MRDGDTKSRESVVGEEAHIVARSPNGPRGGLLPPDEVDKVQNLILLCRNDHRMVDDQPDSYPVDRLIKIKEDHEKWASESFKTHSIGPARLRRDPTSDPLVTMRILETGSDVWEVIDGSLSYRFVTLDEGEAEAEQCDLSDDFLDLARDSAEVSDSVTDSGQRAIREITRSLGTELAKLREKGLVVFGGRRKLILTGGKDAPMDWWESVLQVRLHSEDRPNIWYGKIE